LWSKRADRQATLKAFFADIGPEACAWIRHAAIDMFEACAQTIRKWLPNATLVSDSSTFSSSRRRPSWCGERVRTRMLVRRRCSAGSRSTSAQSTARIPAAPLTLDCTTAISDMLRTS